ncbi:SH3 domain-containing protein [Novosphingobium sp.]|uniref:SH3 domain-containing protein n=1 Tax=Novosphingobium sp. TaxID=1874826 RepID=UPI003BA965A2
MRSIFTLAALLAATVPLAPAAAQSIHGYTSGPTRLYSGPLRDYPSVRTLRRGSMVNLQGCLRDWSWCDVTYRGDRGWIAGDALRISHDGRRRGIASGMGIGVTTFLFGSYWDNHYQGRRFYGERQRWQSQYDSGYRPEWGEREQRRDEGSNRGRMHDRRQSEGQHGQDQRSDNRQGQDQQRRDHASIPRSAAEPYRLPQHGERAAQPSPRNPGPGNGAANAYGRNDRMGHRPDQGTAHDDAAGHPHN